MKLDVELSGGHLDGRRFVAELCDDESELAVQLFRLSNHGTIGKKFDFIPPEELKAIQILGHEDAVEAGYHSWPVSYVVTDCVRLSDCITVRAKQATRGYSFRPSGQYNALDQGLCEGRR